MALKYQGNYPLPLPICGERRSMVDRQFVALKTWDRNPPFTPLDNTS